MNPLNIDQILCVNGYHGSGYIPAEAWRWAQEAHLAGQIIRVPDMNWTATGKASINESELPAAWSVNHSEGWISAVSEVWTP